MDTDSEFKGPVLLIGEPLAPGGIAVYTRSLLDGLAQNGISYKLLTSLRPAEGTLTPEELKHVQLVPGLFWSVWRPFIFRRLIEWAREQEPALIHGLSALTTPICAQLSKELEIPFIVSVHHFQKPGGLRKEANCHAFIAVSESLRENLVNDARIPREFVRVIPAGVRVPKELAPRPAEYQAATSIPLVSSFGKLIKRKDYATFLRAAKVVIEKLGARISFVILGEGPEETALRKLARELAIGKQVMFVDSTGAIEAVFRDTDVYVQCSRQEGFGSNVLQAMAHGVPVVATAAGGMLSLVKDGETGYLVPVGDHEALAARIVELLSDHELAARIGDAGRKEAAENYDLGAMMNATINLYTDAVGVETRITKATKS